jgi:hypothetical protein
MNVETYLGVMVNSASGSCRVFDCKGADIIAAAAINNAGFLIVHPQKRAKTLCAAVQSRASKNRAAWQRKC